MIYSVALLTDDGLKLYSTNADSTEEALGKAIMIKLPGHAEMIDYAVLQVTPATVMDEEILRITKVLGQRIAAIKYCREQTGWGVREAMNYCDELVQRS